MDFPLYQFSAAAGGWTLTGLFVLAMLSGHLMTRRSHEREMSLVTKRAELAEERATRAEAQRDQLLMPLAAVADRTFRALPQSDGANHVSSPRQRTETPRGETGSTGGVGGRGTRPRLGRRSD